MYDTVSRRDLRFKRIQIVSIRRIFQQTGRMDLVTFENFMLHIFVNFGLALNIELYLKKTIFSSVVEANPKILQLWIIVKTLTWLIFVSIIICISMKCHQ